MTVRTKSDPAKTLRRNGWVRVPADDGLPLDEAAASVLGAAARAGESTTLAPRTRARGRPFSLSAEYGMAAFDAHTDGAADLVPPRWCAMRLAPGARTKTPTLLWDVRSVRLGPTLIDALHRTMWIVRGGDELFYSSILRRHGETEILRYNMVCMSAVGRASTEARSDLNNALLLAEPVAHSWRSREILIFDNWRVLHARPTVGRGDAETRRLERLLISGEL